MNRLARGAKSMVALEECILCYCAVSGSFRWVIWAEGLVMESVFLGIIWSVTLGPIEGSLPFRYLMVCSSIAAIVLIYVCFSNELSRKICLTEVGIWEKYRYGGMRPCMAWEDVTQIVCARSGKQEQAASTITRIAIEACVLAFPYPGRSPIKRRLREWKVRREIVARIDASDIDDLIRALLGLAPSSVVWTDH